MLSIVNSILMPSLTTNSDAHHTNIKSVPCIPAAVGSKEQIAIPKTSIGTKKRNADGFRSWTRLIVGSTI
jgi:hypothetical protein